MSKQIQATNEDEKHDGLFAIRFWEALRMRGMSQVDFHRATGISTSSINQYLSGVNEPRYSRLREMARALAVHPAWLLGIEDAGDRPQESASPSLDPALLRQAISTLTVAIDLIATACKALSSTIDE